jgi:Fe-S-cluster containining protein
MKGHVLFTSYRLSSIYETRSLICQHFVFIFSLGHPYSYLRMILHNSKAPRAGLGHFLYLSLPLCGLLQSQDLSLPQCD